MSRSLPQLVGFAAFAALSISAAANADEIPASDDPALTPAPIVHSPQGKFADAERIFQGIPGIERSPGGRLWATWYAGGPDQPGEGPGNFVVLVTSGDDGKTWSKPALAVAPPSPLRAYDPALWVDPEKRLWLFWAQSYEWWDGRAGVWTIVTENPDDEHPKWSEPRRLCDGIMMNKPTVLSTGEWLLPAAIWSGPPQLGNKKYAHDTKERGASGVVVSSDRGATWNLLGKSKVPKRSYDEHLLVERKDSSLWMLVRTFYGIGESVSTDRGKTWGEGKPTGFPHVDARFFIRRLNSGRLLLVSHDPVKPGDSKTRANLIARLSDDDGKTWTGGLVIDEREGVSYPDGTQSADGTIYLIYDYNRTTDKQILMATFDESDVAAGAWKSKVARQRVLVNQATGVRGK